MKIRQGFVSNSSSTSFCICGICLGDDEVKELFGVDDCYDLYKNEIEVYSEGDYSPIYVGVDIDKMQEDETKAEFRHRVKKLLDDIATKDIGSVDLLVDGWRDD